MTLFDLIYVALFTLVGPLYGYTVGWPKARRRLQDAPAQARRWLWTTNIRQLWAQVAIGAAAWVYFGRPWSALKLDLPEGWRLLVAIVVVGAYATYQLYCIAALRRNPALREQVRASLGELGTMLPHTRAEVRMFAAVSATAGFCEEFLFRGYLLWVLAHWLGWWGAAAVSIPLFGLLHGYQGVGGMVKTGIFGAIYLAIIALTDSLWPAIVWHVLVDAFAGVMAWMVLREAPAAR